VVISLALVQLVIRIVPLLLSGAEFCQIDCMRRAKRTRVSRWTGMPRVAVLKNGLVLLAMSTCTGQISRSKT
jgi:hypothetical protein